jgi:N-acetylmuramoyl-L-alanine amidase
MKKKIITGIFTIVLVMCYTIVCNAEEGVYHAIKSGDTLYGIARKHGVEVSELKKLNGLKNTLILCGKTLRIPEKNNNDIYLMAKIINAEARGESFEGQIAVGAVIMNRLKSGKYPKAISRIIYQRINGVYQFTPVQDGQIKLEPEQKAFNAAERAIKGDDPTGGAIFFYNPEISSDQWIRTLPVTKAIGNHVFAK